MPLQIRRGFQSELDLITPGDGEIIYVKPSGAAGQKLYIGDGVTPGNELAPVTGFAEADSKDATGEVFTSGTHSGISFAYNSSTKTINATVNIENYNGVFVADGFKGSLFADNSTLLVDAVGGFIPASVVQGTFTGTVSGNVTGNVTGDLSGNATTATNASNAYTVSLTATNSTAAEHFLTFVDTATGNEDIRTATGLTFNPSTNTLSTTTFSGDLEGSVTGNIYTNLLTSADSSEVLVGTQLHALSNLLVDEDIINSGRFLGQYVGASTISTGQITSADDLSIAPAGITFLGSYSEGRNGTLYITQSIYTNTFGNGFTFAQHHNTADAINFNFYRTRGTPVAPTSVQNLDDIIDIGFWAWDGSTVAAAGSITASVDGTPTTGNVPTKIRFATNNGTSTAYRGEVAKDGSLKFDALSAYTASTPVSINSMLKLPSYASEAAASTAVGGSLADGMMYYDTGAARVKVRSSGAWIALW